MQTKFNATQGSAPHHQPIGAQAQGSPPLLQGSSEGRTQLEHWIVMELCTLGSLQVRRGLAGWHMSAARQLVPIMTRP